MMPGRSARGGDGRHFQDVPSDTTACRRGMAGRDRPRPNTARAGQSPDRGMTESPERSPTQAMRLAPKRP
jgi:hypothetical protein